MPLYVMESEAGEIQDMYYTMAEVPRLGQVIDIEGVKWKRVFSAPNAAINSVQTDPHSAKDFNRQFDGKKVTVGDMWDASKEASLKRAGTSGQDHIKKTYYDNYAKERKGIRHQAERKETTDKQMDVVRKEIKKILPT